MTAITPLEFIHKKGTFGDHQKKNESDLLKISEVKNLTIIQLAQYKGSKININDVKIEDLIFPNENSKVKTPVLPKASQRIISFSPGTII